MLLYPPGPLYQRGENRCQLNVSESSANAVRACNDLGYVSAILKKRGYSVYLRDYQSENLSLENLISEVVVYSPDIIFISTTNSSIFDDLKILCKIKKIKNDIVFILKGAIFFNCDQKFLNHPDFQIVDYLISGEEEFIIGDLVDYHFNSPKDISKISGIIYNDNGKFVRTEMPEFYEDLDSLPFPDRSEMNNDLYIMPDTGEKLATIFTSRGCPSSCIYCLSPKISGSKLRTRSPQNVLEELKECYYKFGIKNFFFKSDTFTMDSKWVMSLCNAILASELKGKIKWVANSRVNTVNIELLSFMKKAGCHLIAFGLESGSDESLEKMKKYTTTEMNYKAVQMAKKVGLQTFGFYIIGFPWEDFSHFDATKRAMFKNNTDFIELHIATPFVGTQLYDMLKIDGKNVQEPYGKGYFSAHSAINPKLRPEDVEKYRKNIVLQYYTRPLYILKKILLNIHKPKVIANYFRYGFRILKNFFNFV